MAKIFIVFFVALLAVSVQANELQVGQWEGKVTMPDMEPAKAVFRVRSKKSDDKKTFKVEMFYIERPYKFGDLKIGENELRFSIDTGEEYACILWFEDDAKSELEECHDRQGYCGQCLHESESEVRKIIINMAQPPDAPEPDEAQPPETADPEASQATEKVEESD